jgi:hypothetical protein
LPPPAFWQPVNPTAMTSARATKTIAILFIEAS